MSSHDEDKLSKPEIVSMTADITSAYVSNKSIDPDQLFDLEDDPNELVNLAKDIKMSDVITKFRTLLDSNWNLSRFDEEVRRSQVRRWIVYEALRNGEYYPWDYQPIKKASERFMRNHMDLNKVEERQRFPRTK